MWTEAHCGQTRTAQECPAWRRVATPARHPRYDCKVDPRSPALEAAWARGYEPPVALRIAAVAYTHYESDPRVRREAEALSGRGDEVTVFALRRPDTPAEEVVRGVRVVRLDLPRYRGGQALAYAWSYTAFLGLAAWHLTREHQRARLDVVHVHTMPDFMVFAAALPRLTGARVILDMHDLMPELYALKFGLSRDGVVARGLRAAQWAATTFADYVICVHQPQYELLLRDHVPPRKLAIVMNAADPELFPARKKEPRLKEDGPIRVVYHGTLLRRYGVDVALEAFARARQVEPRLELRVYGGGDFAAELAALAQRLGLTAPSFEMTGAHRPLDEVAAAIRDAHIGLVPGRDEHEDSVLPTKLLEYMAVGIPTVATRTRTVSRFFDARHTELVPEGDVEAMAQALLRLAGDKDRRKALTDGGWAWQEEYGWPVQRGLLFRTVDSVCADKVEAARRQAQAAVEGVKTGPRRDPRGEADSNP